MGVETKFNKFGVDTRFNKLGLEINGKIEEANSLGSMKVLIYCSNPAVVETIVDRKDNEEMYPKEPILLAKFKSLESRYVVLTKSKRFGVETKFNKFSDETRFNKLGVETKLRRLGDETTFRRFGVETKFNKLAVDT